MNGVGTAFEDYVLDYFIKIQLLFDESFKYVRVSEIPSIQINPKISDKKVHISFGKRDDVINKHFIELLNELSEFNAFKLNPQFKINVLSFYAAYKQQLKSIDLTNLLQNWDHFLLKKTSKVSESYYIQYIQFIDLLLLCKSTDYQKKTLLEKRKSLLSTSYLQLPTISDEKFKSSIVDAFKISSEVLNSKILKLQTQISKRQVVDYLDSQDALPYRYKSTDFETLTKYTNWKCKVDTLQKDMTDLFNDSIDSSKSSSAMNENYSHVPNQLEDAVKTLTVITFNANSKFFQGYMKCMQLWQIDPFEIYFDFLQAASPSEIGKIDPELVEKALSLAYLGMTVQIEFNDWPLKQKTKFFNISVKIFASCRDSIRPVFGNFFQDIKSFTTCLSFIKLLKLTSKGMQARDMIKEEFKKSLTNRLNDYLSKLSLNFGDSSNINFEKINKLLVYINRDFNLLYNWKFKNKDLNLTFQIYEISVNYLTTPVLNFVKELISKIRNQFGVEGLISQDNQTNFSTLLELLSTLKNRTGFKFNFQDSLYEDFLKVVSSWELELLNKIKLCIENDKNLIRLDGCSYSSSVQNVMGICNAYIKLLESFMWENKLQLAELYVVLYRSISHGLIYYYKKMMEILTLNLNKSDGIDFEGRICTCLNNISKVLIFFKDFKTEKVFECSKTLIQNNKQLLKNPRKLISVTVKNAENIEDLKGDAISLKVVLTGLVNGSTRCIYKDYNPEWQEEFESFLNKDSEKRFGNKIKIDLIDGDSNNVYKSISHKINMNETGSTGSDEKLSLMPKSGSLIISVNVEFEKHDPLFYILRAENEIQKGRTRSIKLFVDKISDPIKNIFTREYLDSSLKESPVRSENNYKKLRDDLVDSYVGEMQVKTIPSLYDNLETELFDQVILQLWLKILNSAENLLLPRVSLIFHKILTRLNKKNTRTSLAIGGPSLNSTVRNTTREDVIRVVEWCFKFRAMLDMPEWILPDPLTEPFETFNKIKGLLQMPESDLKKSYYDVWKYIYKNMMKRYTRGIKYDKQSWECASKDKTMILRVLLAKGDIKFVKNVIELEERYQRAVKTEIEVAYLHQSIN